MTKTIFRPMETPDLLEALRIHLRTHDTEYAGVENACQEAVQSLKNALKPDTSLPLDAYLAAEEMRITACLRFLFWQGLHLNEACFRDPIQQRFLDLDFEDICQETILNNLPEAHRAYEAASSLHRELAEEQRSLPEPVTEYYCHLETVGYKLAHFWGFRYGDDLLPQVVPGYVPDSALTGTYRRMVREYLEFDPER